MDGLEKARLDPSAGYTIVHSPGDRLRDGYDVRITAHAPGTDPQAAHAAVGLQNFFNAGGVGELQLRYSGKTNRSATAYSHQVYVHPDHRRKGVASAMYRHAEQVLGVKMVPSKDRTKDGKALWVGNKGDPQFGKVELPDGSGFFTATVGKSEESLAKAIDPKDLAPIAKASDPAGAKLVDHRPHLTGHPAALQPSVDAYRSQVLNSPEKVKKVRKAASGISDGITKKVMYDTGAGDTYQRYMVKPYHERVIQRVSKWMKHPHQGWAEMANQALYHAGGIGHLHQGVHVDEHDFGTGTKEPALVVHLAKDHIPAANARQGLMGDPHDEDPVLQGPHFDAKKIAVMDFLTNNLDRHGGNLLRPFNGKGILAIDHSRSFQYQSPNDDRIKHTAPTKRPRELADTFGAYHHNSAIEHLSPLLPPEPRTQNREEFHRSLYDARMKALQAYAPVINDWWGQAGPHIRSEMERQLQQITDPKVRDHIKRNFEARADWLDERANIGLENYGDDWYKNEVPMYRVGEMTDEERSQAESRAAAEQWARENPDKV
jgi:GNAT superfamily N-acetyltransferase